MSWLLVRSRNGKTALVKRIAVQTTIYVLWKERNCRIHHNISLSADCIFRQIDRAIRDTLLARRFRKGCNDLLSLWSAFS
ncbi:unnamed protein product [Arabis nemorensis]|uniref:Reverse transcriptase zinc-binding domain-containing protein n=1 Tax=Arabis nemorensis TaxID=586526 RepID=A0A565CFL9_9BRAS|nr:unnamed protein product [Arabis nemorensis]